MTKTFREVLKDAELSLSDCAVEFGALFDVEDYTWLSPMQKAGEDFHDWENRFLKWKKQIDARYQWFQQDAMIYYALKHMERVEDRLGAFGEKASLSRYEDNEVAEILRTLADALDATLVRRYEELKAEFEKAYATRSSEESDAD